MSVCKVLFVRVFVPLAFLKSFNRSPVVVGGDIDEESANNFAGVAVVCQH
jgi:hypothetical protein